MIIVITTRRDAKKMKINNPKEIIGREVVDVSGVNIGRIDKFWNSWDFEFPGHFFGIRANENARDTFFRGTNKLIPIYSDYIQESGEVIKLNKTVEELCRHWNKTVPCGPRNHPIDDLIEKPVYDKDQSRVGTFFTWVESDGTYKTYGLILDPFLCESWQTPHNQLMPLPTNYITDVFKDTISIDKTVFELKEFWQKQHKT